MLKKIDPAVKKLSLAEKKKLLQTEIAIINKKYKKEVVKMGYDKQVKRIPFKSEKLNKVTGGGVGVGRFNVIWGAKGSAKTTGCYELVAKAQEMGKLCYWIDMERSYDPVWAKTIGVNTEDISVASGLQTAENAMDSVIQLTKSKVVDLVIIDSIQGLSPRGEQEEKSGKEKSLDDDSMALLARKLSQFFRMSAAGVAESECTVALIGQTRKDLGGFITLDKLSGGNALEHWSSLTIHFRRGQAKNAPTKKEETDELTKTGKNKMKSVPIGFELVAKVNKSKLGPDEGNTVSVPFLFGQGIGE